MFGYKVIRSQRRTIGIYISRDKGVVVRAPYRAKETEIRKFVEQKSEWIEKHLARFEEMKSLSHSGINGERIMFRGKEYPVSVIQSNNISVTLKEGVIEIRTPDLDNKSAAEAIIELWYRKNAEVILRNIFHSVLVRYSHKNFRPTHLTIRKMKGKWGSCTSRGRITLNSDLIKLDDSLTEYVITHELCHLNEPNHGQDFYALLGELSPQWQELRNRLKEYII